MLNAVPRTPAVPMGVVTWSDELLFSFLTSEMISPKSKNAVTSDVEGSAAISSKD
jgi:hypothetical protein